MNYVKERNAKMSNDKPLVTIVVPIYKVPYDMLRRCLKSIETQTSDNFEVILIDDGSPDDCGKICDQFVKTHSFSRVIHQKNQGLSVVRNNGVDNARGDWVCFVDGDDWIEPNTVESIENYVEEYPDFDVLIWDEYADVDNVSKENYFFGKRNNAQMVFIEDECKELIGRILPDTISTSEETMIDIGTANARAYRKAFLIDNNLYNRPGLRRMQDNIFNLWVFNSAKKICYQCIHLYHYSYNEASATKRYDAQVVDTMYFLYECFSEFLESAEDRKKNGKGKNSLYLKCLILIYNCFSLKYANSENPDSIHTTYKNICSDMSKPLFEDAIRNCNTSRQPLKFKIFHFLLKHKLYYSALLLTRFHSKTRRLRAKM